MKKYENIILFKSGSQIKFETDNKGLYDCFKEYIKIGTGNAFYSELGDSKKAIFVFSEICFLECNLLNN